eukprot:scaffold24019_cov159-Skeletonema_dohrnii-CCMP3373.AAC.1
MSPNDGQTIIANDDNIVLMSPPLIDRRLKNNNSNDRTASSTPATSTSSSPYLQPSTPPHVPSGFALQLNDAIASADLEQQEDTSNGNIVVSSSLIRNDVVIASPASQKSLRTHNPIRAIVDPIMAHSVKCGKERGDGKDQISLALGDPTAYGNIPPCPVIISAITDALQAPGMAAGYVNAVGTAEARHAIHKYHYPNTNNTNLDDREADSNIVVTSPDDVIVANGASGALELGLTALLDEDSVLLVPRPGFPLYQVIAESHGARVVHYDLLPNQGWECDLDHIDRIISEEEENAHDVSTKVVRGIVVNNPSNPTGAVYSEEHLMQIIKLAEKWNVPIIADEIYGDLVFGNNVFHPMANVASKLGYTVPIITASGLGKQYAHQFTVSLDTDLIPGWRLGWLIFQDSRHGSIHDVKKGAQRLAQVVLGASRLAQVVIPAVLDPSAESDVAAIAQWKEHLYTQVENQAALLCGLLKECQGLEVIHPQGAMYAMIKIHAHLFDEDIYDDVSFMKLLLEEENIVVLPGRAFGMGQEEERDTPVFRVVFCAPEDVLRCASERISSFCSRHAV